VLNVIRDSDHRVSANIININNNDDTALRLEHRQAGEICLFSVALGATTWLPDYADGQNIFFKY